MGLCRLYKLVQTFFVCTSYDYIKFFTTSTSTHKPFTWHIKNKYIAQITPLYTKYPPPRTAAMLSLSRSSIFTYYTNKRPLCASNKVCKNVRGGGIKRGRSATEPLFAVRESMRGGDVGLPLSENALFGNFRRLSRKLRKKLFG